MEWNLMEPGGSGAGGLGCFVEDIYVPSDDCAEVLDELLETLAREDPKLRNGRRKLGVDKTVENDLVPLIMCCIDEDIIGRTVRLLANLTQPLEVFLQVGVDLGQHCQREINNLVNGAKARCTDLDFFKSLHNRMEMALLRDGMDKVAPSDSELLNHALLLVRNLLHTNPEERQTSESSITLQSMLSSFFLSEMDKLVMNMLNHPQKSDWVVSTVQLMSLVFKDHAGVLLEGDAEEEDKYDSDDCKSDCDSDILDVAPSQTSKILSHNFDKQLHLDEVFMATEEEPQSDGDGNEAGKYRENINSSQPRDEKTMMIDEDPKEEEDEGTGQDFDRGESPTKSEPIEEEMSMTDVGENKNLKPTSQHSLTKENVRAFEISEGKAVMNVILRKLCHDTTDTDSGRPDSRDDVKPGESSPVLSEDCGKPEKVEEYAAMLWDHMNQGVREKEREIMSELSTGSCLMDSDIIVSYLRKFASDIVCSGLSNLVRCLMKALMSSYEGVLDDSFFMWTVGFFLSYARHTHIAFEEYRDLLNLDVFGFLVYQGYRNCETLACQMQKQENCSLVKYRLHLVVCTLNQLFQVLLAHTKDTGHNEEYIRTVQKCLAQMGDLQRLFVLLIRSHQSSCQDVVYLRDLIHTNHSYLQLLEEWVSCGYLPHHFSMLSHVQQYATADVMQKYGSLLEQYSNNSELLNVAVLTMMYHIAGDCNRGELLLQLPILKIFSEIWGDVTCTKYAEFNDLIEFVLETFMSMAFKDPVKCAQKLFDMTAADLEEAKSCNSSDSVPDIGGLTEEEEDLLFTWSTDLQGSVSMVDDLVRRLHNQGSTATRQHVMLHLLRNGWLEEKQMEALSDEIKELQEKTSAGNNKQNSLAAELAGLDHDQLLPFLVEKIKDAGFQDQLKTLQDQLLEAAYVKLGVRDSNYRVHVEEPMARFYALQDKSIPLVVSGEEEERVVRDPYFTALLQGLGLFPADTGPSCVFCRIPNFLTPSQLIRKAQQLGDIDLSMVKFDLATVKDDLHYPEFSPMFKDHDSAGDQKKDPSVDFKPTAQNQGHQWMQFVCHVNRSNEATQS